MHTAQAMQMRQAALQIHEAGPQTSTSPAKVRKGNGKGSQRTLQHPGTEAGPSAASSDVQSQALIQVQPASPCQQPACCAAYAQVLSCSSAQHIPA